MARDMSVTYVSQYSPCVFADLTITKVVELSLNTEVLYIELWGQKECEIDSIDVDIPVSQIPNRLETIRVDEVVEDFSLTGNGVKIGQIEPACPTESTIILNPDYDNTLVDGNISYHANNVYTIMKSVAPNATYYATGTRLNDYTIEDGSFQAQVEWLLSQGVNIINMSAGVSFTGYVDTYTAEARWIDHIAYNHDVHFVKAAGNTMRDDIASELRGVSSPGMAYNIITVGNSFHVSTNSDGTYDRYPSSSYNDNGVSRTEYRTFKPDIMAPGTYDLINGSYAAGTSYATPLVTGTIALLCEYKPALKTKQHIVKAILAASTSKDKGRYVTIDDKFVEYGAGMLDARAAMHIIISGKYSTSTGRL